MHRILLPAALLTLISLLVTSCGSSAAPISGTSTGGESSVDDVAVSGGGVQTGTDVLTLFYGTAVNKGKRRYTYLVVGPVNAVEGNYRNTKAGTSSIADGAIVSDDTLEINGVSLSARFTATHDVRGNLMVDPVLTLQGEAVSPADGWFFLFDWSDPNSTPRHVAVLMPELPMELDDLDSFTAEFVTELTRTREMIAEFVSD